MFVHPLDLLHFLHLVQQLAFTRGGLAGGGGREGGREGCERKGCQSCVLGSKEGRERRREGGRTGKRGKGREGEREGGREGDVPVQVSEGLGGRVKLFGLVLKGGLEVTVFSVKKLHLREWGREGET